MSKDGRIITRSPKLFPVIVPGTLVLLALQLWVGYWFFLAAQAETRMDKWLARQVRSGVEIQCGERHKGGFPLTISIDCARPWMERKGGKTSQRYSAEKLVVTASAFNPRDLTARLTGPVEITGVDVSGAKTTVTMEPAVAHIKLDGKKLRDFSLTVNKLTARNSGGRGDRPAPELKLAGLQLDLLRRAAGDPVPAYDVKMAVTGLTATGKSPSAPLFTIETARLQAVLHKAANRVRLPLGRWLKKWLRAGGEVEIRSLKIRETRVDADATGRLGVDGRNRLRGSLDLRIGRITALLEDLRQRRLIGKNGNAFMQMILGLIGNPDKNGGQSAELGLTFRKGRVYFGPFPLGKTPPLF
jgi:hypothetical protein